MTDAPNLPESTDVELVDFADANPADPDVEGTAGIEQEDDQ